MLDLSIERESSRLETGLLLSVLSGFIVFLYSMLRLVFSGQQMFRGDVVVITLLMFFGIFVFSLSYKMLRVLTSKLDRETVLVKSDRAMLILFMARFPEFKSFFDRDALDRGITYEDIAIVKKKISDSLLSGILEKESVDC